MRNVKPLTILCGCTARFVSDLVGNPEDRFSHNEAQIWPILPLINASNLEGRLSGDMALLVILSLRFMNYQLHQMCYMNHHITPQLIPTRVKLLL